MHENQSVDATLGDQPGNNDGLAEGGGCSQHAYVMLQHRICRGLLLRPELALKIKFKRRSDVTLVANDGFDVQVTEKCCYFLQTAARKTYVVRVIFGTGDDAWLVIRRESHRLSLAKFRILKCREAKEPIAQRGRQRILGNENLICEHQLQADRQSAYDRGCLPSTRRRNFPGRFVFFL